MELQHLWVRMKQKEGFIEYNYNFSDDFHLEIYSSKEFIFEEKARVKIFNTQDGKGVNQIYGIIGRNGTGKTTFLRKLIEENYLSKILDGNLEINGLVKVGDKLKVKKFYGNNKFKNFYIEVLKKNLKIEEDNQNNKIEINKLENTIYYNPYLGNFIPEEKKNLRDVSYEKRFSNFDGDDSFYNIWLEDLKLIYEMQNLLSKDEFKYLNEILVGSSKENPKKIDILYSARELAKEIEDSIIDYENEDVKNYEFINYIYRQIQKKIILYYISDFYSESNNKDSFKEKFDKLSLKKEHQIIEEEWKEENHSNKNEGKAIFLLQNDKFKKLYLKKNRKISSIEDIESYLLELEKNIQNNCINITSKAPSSSNGTNRVFEIEATKILGNEVLMLPIKEGWLNIKTGFSDGQWAVLKLFSIIFHEFEKYKGDDEVLLILDEGDMGFHPEWQRKYLNRVVSFINNFFSEIRTNIFFASHSPFIASDLPSDNIIFLGSKEEVENAKKTKTFGANIHELYSSSFFLGSTMGEFALDQIKEVINKLTSLECLNRKDPKGLTSEDLIKIDEIKSEKYKIKYIIDSIGEKVLSRKLEEKYFEVFRENLNEKEKNEKELEEKWLSLSKGKRAEMLKKMLGDSDA